MQIVERVFRPVFGRPCWQVQQGYGSFLTLEFGQPHLKVRNPEAPQPGDSPKIRRMKERRIARVYGDWHLWIYCCDWKIVQDGKEAAHSESAGARIRRAARDLDGQMLQQVVVIPRDGKTQFRFDLGGTLYTWPTDRKQEQWLLYEPSGQVLTMRGDGQYQYGPGDVNVDEWHVLAGKSGA